MADRFRVGWTEAAVADLERIVTWSAEDSPVNARAVLKRIEHRAGALATSPRRGHVVPELAALGHAGHRELTIAPYRLVFRIDRKSIWVEGVFDARRAFDEALQDRFLAGMK